MTISACQHWCSEAARVGRFLCGKHWCPRVSWGAKGRSSSPGRGHPHTRSRKGRACLLRFPLIFMSFLSSLVPCSWDSKGYPLLPLIEVLKLKSELCMKKDKSPKYKHFCSLYRHLPCFPPSGFHLVTGRVPGVLPGTGGPWSDTHLSSGGASLLCRPAWVGGGSELSTLTLATCAPPHPSAGTWPLTSGLFFQHLQLLVLLALFFLG